MRFQFTLQTLLLSAVVIWSSMAVFGPGGLLLAAVILTIVACIRSAESMWRAAAVVFSILLYLLALLLPAFQAAQETGRRATCINNLKQLALALWSYHDDHGCFPPAYVADANGKPMHSWRVLLLPYIWQGGLHKQYDFSQPWDGPNNRKLAQVVIPAYVCPSSRNWASMSPMTDYVAVVGPQTVWRKGKPIKVDEIPDGTSNTIMLVEIANSDINWMEPRDVSFEEAVRSGVSSHHVRDNGYFYHATPVVNIALADGTVWTLPQGLPPEMLEALLTIDGGEDVDVQYCATHVLPPRLNWTNCVAVVALVASVLLLLLRPRRKLPQGPPSPGVESP